MSLSKERNRLRMRKYREELKEVSSWEVEVQPEVKKVQPEVTIQCEQPSIAQEVIPYYKKGMNYKAGSKVIYKGSVTEVPELDLDGNVLWE